MKKLMTISLLILTFSLYAEGPSTNTIKTATKKDIESIKPIRKKIKPSYCQVVAGTMQCQNKKLKMRTKTMPDTADAKPMNSNIIKEIK